MSPDDILAWLRAHPEERDATSSITIPIPPGPNAIAHMKRAEERVSACADVRCHVTIPTPRPRPGIGVVRVNVAEFRGKTLLLVTTGMREAMDAFMEDVIASVELDGDETHSVDDGCPGGHRAPGTPLPRNPSDPADEGPA